MTLIIKKAELYWKTKNQFNGGMQSVTKRLTRSAECNICIRKADHRKDPFAILNQAFAHLILLLVLICPGLRVCLHIWFLKGGITTASTGSLNRIDKLSLFCISLISSRTERPGALQEETVNGYKKSDRMPWGISLLLRKFSLTCNHSSLDERTMHSLAH